MQQVCVHVCVCVCVCVCVRVCACVLKVETKGVREWRESCTASQCHGGADEVCVSTSSLCSSQDYALAIAELQQCSKMKPALLAPLLKYLGRLNLAVSHSQTDCLCDVSDAHCCAAKIV